MKNMIIIGAIFFHSFLFSTSISNELISNKSYITGEDGVIRMYLNIVGNVKNPGTYLVYDGIDFMSSLSLAGGFLPGSNLKEVKIFRENKSVSNFNLEKYLNGEVEYNDIKLMPHDTILIEEKITSKLFFSSNLPYLVLSILNIALTIDRTD